MYRSSNTSQFPRKLAFSQILEFCGLLSYRARLLSEGFDDAETLCDMTDDDMVIMGIRRNHRETLQRIFTQLRSDATDAAPSPGR